MWAAAVEPEGNRAGLCEGTRDYAECGRHARKAIPLSTTACRGQGELKAESVHVKTESGD